MTISKAINDFAEAITDIIADKVVAKLNGSLTTLSDDAAKTTKVVDKLAETKEPAKKKATKKAAVETEIKPAGKWEKVAVDTEAPAEEAQEEEAPAEEEVKTYTDVQVRAKLKELMKAGKREEIKKLFGKYGADSLSGVSEDDYSALMKDAEEL